MLRGAATSLDQDRGLKDSLPFSFTGVTDNGAPDATRGTRRAWPLWPTGASKPAAINARATGARRCVAGTARVATAGRPGNGPFDHREVADDSDEGTGAEPEPPTKAPAKRFDLRSHLTRLFGTDHADSRHRRKHGPGPTNWARICPAFRPRRNRCTTRSLVARSSAHTPVPAPVGPPRRCNPVVESPTPQA